LVETELMAKLILGNGVGVVDLVTENDEGDLRKLLHREKGVEFSLGLGESVVVLGVDEEDNPIHLGEVVLPKTTSCVGGTKGFALVKLEQPGSCLTSRRRWRNGVGKVERAEKYIVDLDAGGDLPC